jgi:hypothetical protein
MAKKKEDIPFQSKAMIRRTEKSMKDKKAAFMKKCNADPDFKKFPVNKRILLYAVKLCRGHITNACAMVNITRKTFHNYCNDDPDFEEAFLTIKLGMLDHVVGKLFERIDAGSDSSIQFYLDRQGKDQGWGNSLKVDGKINNINYNVPLTDDEVKQYAKALEDEF